MRIAEKCPVCGCLPGEFHANDGDDCGFNLRRFCDCGDLHCRHRIEYCDLCGDGFPTCWNNRELEYDDVNDEVLCTSCKEIAR